MSAPGDVRADFHAGAEDFAREGFRVREGARARSGEADIHRVDPKGLHQMNNFDFFVD